MAQFPRNRVFISTKWGPMFKPDGQMSLDFSPEACRAACEGSLKRLGVDYIDLWVMRGPCRGEGALEAAVRTMKVRRRAHFSHCTHGWANAVDVACLLGALIGVVQTHQGSPPHHVGDIAGRNFGDAGQELWVAGVGYPVLLGGVMFCTKM